MTSWHDARCDRRHFMMAIVVDKQKCEGKLRFILGACNQQPERNVLGDAHWNRWSFTRLIQRERPRVIVANAVALFARGFPYPHTSALIPETHPAR